MSLKVSTEVVHNISSNMFTPEACHSKSMVISPTALRVLSLTSPSNLQLMNQGSNDDAEEKKRRRSAMLEKQKQSNISSPSVPGERRKSLAATAVLSNIQIAEHYASCIKLSAENKITSKNAFGLHLIDYMSEELKKNGLNDFQVASSTLDASAKIYAGRVDAIHTETYKVLSGLGRGVEQKPDEGIEIDPDTAVEEDGDNQLKKVKQIRKRKGKGNNVETNLKKISLPQLDVGFQVDPLFQKMSATFDSAATDGLLLSQLHTLDNCAVVFDGSTVVNSNTNSHRSDSKVNITDFSDHYKDVNFKSLELCPEFKDFELTKWSDEEDEMQCQETMGTGDHAFDIDQAPEPEVALDTSMDRLSGITHDHDIIAMADGDGDNDSVYSGSASILGDGQETQLVDNVISSIRHSSTMGSLIQVLSTEPSEFCYFKTNLLQTWAGPSHWKMGLRAREASKVAQDGGSKKRSKKEPFEISYHDNKDFDSFFKESPKTTITQQTLVKYSKSKNAMQEQLQYKADQLIELFGKPSVMIKKADEKPGPDLEGAIDDYDYNNKNDCENFCPGIEDDAGEDDYDSQPFEEISPTTQDDENMDSQPTASNQTIYTADNLVAQPWKAEIINIGYAKTAKKVDIKLLKGAIWTILKKAPLNESDKQDTEQKTQESVNGTHSFQILINQIPPMLPKAMIQHLSIPIMYNCLLHLANEKILHIESVPGQDDLLISQG